MCPFNTRDPDAPPARLTGTHRMVLVAGTQRWDRMVLVASTTKRWCRGATGSSGVPVDRHPALRGLRRHYVEQVACKATMARNTGAEIRAFPTAFLQEKTRLMKESVKLRED